MIATMIEYLFHLHHDQVCLRAELIPVLPKKYSTKAVKNFLAFSRRITKETTYMHNTSKKTACQVLSNTKWPQIRKENLFFLSAIHKTQPHNAA
jgi:hypothetical protein